MGEEDNITFLVVDFRDKAVSAALPIIYEAAFHKSHFALIDAADLYEDVFDRAPLSFVNYEKVLGAVSSSRAYDLLKRCVDIIGALIIGFLRLFL